MGDSGRRRLGYVGSALAGCLLLAACAGAGGGAAGPDGSPTATPGAPSSSKEAPLLPQESELPSALPRDVQPSDVIPSTGRADLADAAEQLAEDTYGQKRPRPVQVAAGSTRWQVGSLYRGTFADPDIVEHRGRFYAYGTNTAGMHMPALTSTDLARWQPLTRGGGRADALPRVGSWVTKPSPGRGLWAPAVAEVGGGWTAAYSAKASTLKGGERHNCIGLSRGSSPTGPFEVVGRPICSPNANLGLIDPDIFVADDGTPYLLWKFSGVKAKRPAGLFIRQLNATGTDFEPGAKTRELLRKEHAWEGRTIENPSMIQFRGVTYLFYSGNSWKTSNYATGYAICDGPEGPCVRPKNGHQFLSTARTGNLGPGGASAFDDDNSLRLLYHAWDPGKVLQLRRLHVAGLWQREDGTLRLVHPG
ncbi:glycoside hydrolase family 43 protein [Nocardioides panacisoli]|uniref:glycoside hydrolase family 43 protein n=1 Tax=Nocardioides panacisoli TaxID=627624 RepID=UPI001C635EBB|nr:glycoside hydrolase family 43 protein [Nocardioides panacisoli]QYJ03441.1 glycoside hydrolase family 43 protein [Nocardioides panacisoli]